MYVNKTSVRISPTFRKINNENELELLSNKLTNWILSMSKEESEDTTAMIRVVHIQTPNVLKMILAINGIQISHGNAGDLIPPLKSTNEISDVVHINK